MEAFLYFMFGEPSQSTNRNHLLDLLILFISALLIFSVHFIVTSSITWYMRATIAARPFSDFANPVFSGSFPASPPRRERRALERAARRRSQSPGRYPPPPPPVREHDAAWACSIIDSWPTPYFQESLERNRNTTPYWNRVSVPIGRYDTKRDEAHEALYASAKRVMGPDGNWRWTSLSPEDRTHLDQLASMQESTGSVQVDAAVTTEKQVRTLPAQPASLPEILNVVNTTPPQPQSLAPPCNAPTIGFENRVVASAWPAFFEQHRQVCAAQSGEQFMAELQLKNRLALAYVQWLTDATAVFAPFLNSQPTPAQIYTPSFFEQHREVCEAQSGKQFIAELRLKNRIALVYLRSYPVPAGAVAPVATPVPIPQPTPAPLPAAPVPTAPLVSAPVVIAPPVQSQPASVATPSFSAPVVPAPGPSSSALNISAASFAPTPANRRSRPGVSRPGARPAQRRAMPTIQPDSYPWMDATIEDLRGLRKEKFGFSIHDLLAFKVDTEQLEIPELCSGDNIVTVEKQLDLQKGFMLRLTSSMLRMQLLADSPYQNSKHTILSNQVAAMIYWAHKLASDFIADPAHKTEFYASEKIPHFVHAFRFFKDELFDRHEKEIEKEFDQPVWFMLREYVPLLDALFQPFPLSDYVQTETFNAPQL